MILQDIIPQFPPSYVKENGRTIDWGAGNIIAYASGCCVHLSFVDGDRLKRCCSVEVAPNPITCLSLHHTLRCMVVGDAKGRAFIWEIDNRRFIAFAKSQISNDKCMAAGWKDDVLIILFASKHLCGYKTNNQINTDNARCLELIWDIVLPNNYTSFTIDPHYGKFILFSGKSSVFSIYRVETPHKKPIAYFETITLSNSDEIQEAQWSLHLPGYVFIVLKGEIMLFHMDSRSLVPIINQKITSSVFSFIVQFQNDHSRLLTFHKNGGISVFQAKEMLMYKCVKDFQPKHTQGIIIAAVNSCLRDDIIALYYSNTGLALLDLNSLLIKTVNPIYPANITSFDCDGTNYAYGTDKGFIIFGDMFDVSKLWRFFVGQGNVTYVSFDATHRRIYWQTPEKIGVIDLVKNKVETYQSKVGSAMKCFGSHGGAFIVQRDARAIGVFINDKERPLLTTNEVFDIAVDQNRSNFQQGRFAVLTENKEIKFYTYTPNGIIEEPSGLRARGTDADAVAFCLQEDNFVTAFKDGTLLFYDAKTKEARSVFTEFSSFTKIKFLGDVLYGIGNGTKLFEISGTTKRVCPFIISDFCVINEEVILVKMDDNVVRFITIVDWKPVHYLSRFLPVPTNDEITKKFIQNRENKIGLEYLTEEARDVWQFLNGKNSLRLLSIAGFGEPGYYEELTSRLLEHAGTETPEAMHIKFMSNLFAGNFSLAAAHYANCHPSDPEFLFKSIFAAFLLASDNPMSEQLTTHLKSTAVTLLDSGRYEEGAMIFRIAKLDRQAVDYLLDYDQIELAMRFIRSVLDGKDKESAAFRVGVHKFNNGKYLESLPFFSVAGEYHAVLGTLFSLGSIVDAYFLLKKLLEKDILKPMSDDRLKLFTEMENLDVLIQVIEHQFELTKKRLEL